jgi:hypothetical protein
MGRRFIFGGVITTRPSPHGQAAGSTDAYAAEIANQLTIVEADAPYIDGQERADLKLVAAPNGAASGINKLDSRNDEAAQAFDEPTELIQPPETLQERRKRYFQLAAEREAFAERASDPTGRDTYLTAAKAWRKMAEEIELGIRR